MDGNTGLYLRVLRAAESTLRNWPARFAQVQANAERDLALRMAHDLKSIAATLGAIGLARHARGIEAALHSRRGGFSRRCPHRRRCTGVVTELRRWADVVGGGALPAS